MYKHILLVFLNHSKKSSYTLFQIFLQVDIFNSLEKSPLFGENNKRFHLIHFCDFVKEKLEMTYKKQNLAEIYISKSKLQSK